MNKEELREYKRRWIYDWRRKKGLVMTDEQKEVKRLESKVKSLEMQREKSKTPAYRIKAKYAKFKHFYGLTKEQCDELNRVTDCPICGRHFDQTIMQDKKITRTGAQIDHCHKTGTVRGILCGQCNSLAGKIEAMVSSGMLEKVMAWNAKSNVTNG